MKFNKALVEYVYDIPLQKWNQAQKETWLDLVSRGIVQKNDAKKFAEFGKVFDMYYKKLHKFPSAHQISGAL